MKFVNQDVVYWAQGHTMNDVWAQVARCARVCYQSIKTKEDETDEEFVRRVLLKHDLCIRNHASVLEHGTIYLTITKDKEHDEALEFYRKEHAINEFFKNRYSAVNYKFPSYYITTNLRVIYENNWWEYLKYITPAFQHHHRRYTMSIITNIGVSRELNRHRNHSITEESTRYCNYSKDRFGKELTFTIPSWIDDLDKYKSTYGIVGTDEAITRPSEDDNKNMAIYIYLYSLFTEEYNYMNLLKLGCTPQQARAVLPLNTKTQVIHTAYSEDWERFLDLRYKGLSGPVHPDMKEIANKINSWFHIYDIL